MSENKTGKPAWPAGRYLKYAIGEIILVAIGILIALQVNNWNENRQLRKLEKASITALFSEFNSNKSAMESCKYLISDMRLYGDSIRMQLGPQKSNLEIEQVNHWFGEIGFTRRCEISTDVLNSGNINIISNPEIRRKISKWSSVLKDLEREENEWAQQFSSTITSYLNKWIQWDDVDYNTDSRDDPRYFKSRFSIDPRVVLQQVEFSNIMNNHYWRIKRTEERTISLLQQTEEVIELMREELDKI
ncbi:MAG: hypothetical protein HKO75_07015 [Flavobacteriaceae bacterium]|nr:hypothetical protein [Muriicola sp.]NNL39596.1 hypothetical protein [Flavobacteriaceae bacterium]